MPAAYKNYVNLNTGLVIQNLSGSINRDVTLTYCIRAVTNPNDPAQCVAQTFTNLATQRAMGVNMAAAPVADGWTGSIKIQSTGAVPLAVTVNNAKVSADGYDFSASGLGGTTVYLPRASRNSSGPTTGYTLRNVSGVALNVTARYYKADGSLTWTRTFALSSAATTGFLPTNDTLPDPWDGSIVLSATGNIVAIMREDQTASLSGYNGLVR